MDLSYHHKLSHIGSCLGITEALEAIDEKIRPQDRIVLDAAHGALGYYVYLENKGVAKAEILYEKHGVHQNRDINNQIWVSGGSLGLAGSISLGMAMADRQRDVFVILSDGGLREGIWSESLRIAHDLKITNWKPYLVFNGYAAYGETNYQQVKNQVEGLGFPVEIIRTEYGKMLPLFRGLSAHYLTLDEKTYTEATKQLETWEDKRNKTPLSSGPEGIRRNQEETK